MNRHIQTLKSNSAPIKPKMTQRPTMTVPGRALDRRVLSALLLGSLIAPVGCRIPGLRCAQPGSVQPDAYHWNNGIAFWNNTSSTPSPVLTAPASTSINTPFENQGECGPTVNANVSPAAVAQASDRAVTEPPHEERSFASFVRAASMQRPITQEGTKAKSIDDEIKKMESQIGSDQSQSLLDLPSNDPRATGNADRLPSGPDFGMIDTDIGPTDDISGIVSLENSAQLPLAAFYNDPYLISLITETMTGNQELKILAEEMRIACNEAYARSGEYRPFLTLGAGAGLEKSGRHTREGAVESQLEVAPGTEFPDPLGDFRVGTNVAWELDIWKRLRNSQRAAAMRYLATREGRQFVVTRVVAEVAENYYQLLALDSRLLTLQATIDIQQQSLQVAQAKKIAGRETELAVQRFQAEVQKNISERSLIQQDIVEVENRINFLAGRYPQPVERLTLENFADLHLNTLGAGVPSELLQNRADIREAERQVAAAGLDVLVAKARFYPSLSLTAGLGWNAFSTGYLFRTPESLVYGVAGDLVGPLINKRAIKADYSSANAAQLQAIYDYQRTVLEAHIEVVNEITKIENLRRSIDVKKRQLEALEASVDVAQKLFQNARAEYVEVLLAQRELMEARMELIETKQEQLSAVVTAYQALGGGGF